VHGDSAFAAAGLVGENLAFASTSHALMPRHTKTPGSARSQRQSRRSCGRMALARCRSTFWRCRRDVRPRCTSWWRGTLPCPMPGDCRSTSRCTDTPRGPLADRGGRRTHDANVLRCDRGLFDRRVKGSTWGTEPHLQGDLRAGVRASSAAIPSDVGIDQTRLRARALARGYADIRGAPAGAFRLRIAARRGLLLMWGVAQTMGLGLAGRAPAGDSTRSCVP
jgi:hypothetical protein